MLFLFKKIRRALMRKNKFTTYLLYAIGEIVLVVIGILIAVSINRFNENRKSIQEEKSVLLKLKVEFEENIGKTKAVRERADTLIRDAVLLANMINQRGFELDTVKLPFLQFSILYAHPVLRPSDGVLKEVINSGKLNLIRNDELRKHLASFESEGIGITMHQEFMQQNNNLVQDFQLNHGNFRRHMFILDPDLKESLGVTNSTRPFNYDFMKMPEYDNRLMMYIASINAYRLGTLMDYLSYLESTLFLIDSELKEN